MAYTIEKIYTDNPFVDDLIYYTKILAMGCIIKNETEALAAETVASLKASDLYITSIEGTAPFELFNYPEAVLSASSLNPSLIQSCINNRLNIPVALREEIRQLMMAYIISTYVETNEYYRKIIGLPPVGDAGIFLTEDEIPSGVIIDITIPLHQMAAADIAILNTTGVLTNLIALYPTALYLKYITAGITVYAARLSENFQALYIPVIEATEIYDNFKNKFDQNRLFTIKTIYSEAFKYGSDYYDNFIMIFIVIQTMIDILSELQEGIARRDVFDARCVSYIFESYDIPYYSEIPLNFQISMMKNLNTFLKYKSTSQCMVDICSLFGFNNIQIFKYYLLRDRTVTANGDYLFDTIATRTLQNYEPLTILNTLVQPTIGSNTIIIPFPFDAYFTMGNMLIIEINDKIIDDSKYVIVGTNLTFSDSTILTDVAQVNFKFIYNPQNVNVDTTHQIYIRSYNALVTSPTQLKYTIPSMDYYKKGGSFLIIIGSTFITPDRYTINITDETITFNDTEDWMIVGRNVIFVCIYSDYLLLQNQITSITATEDNQTVFNIPEPFENYCNLGNMFFITMASTYVDSSRYNIVNNILTFLDDGVSLGRDINFNFIYTNPVNINVVTQEVDAVITYNNQTDFTIPFPFSGYVNKNNKLYIKLNGTYLTEAFYTIIQNSLILDSVLLSMTDKLTFVFIYTDTDTAETTFAFETVVNDNQTIFTVPFPFHDFLGNNNVLIVSLNGVIITADEYIISNTTTLTLHPSVITLQGQDLVYTFIYDQYNTSNIAVIQSNVVADSNTVAIPFPFNNYISSGNGILVTINSVFLDPSGYTILDDALICNDSYTISKGTNILFTFIYDTIYTQVNNFITKIMSDVSLRDIAVDESGITIPFPFDNYLSQGNIFMVAISSLVLGDDKYDVIGDELTFTDLASVLLLGTTVTFIFIYLDTGIVTSYSEDYAKNYGLKFIRVPLLNDIDSCIKNNNTHESYDSITESDPLWIGDSTSATVKAAILKQEFNYVRTKYIAIDNVYDLAEVSFEIPYFFNMLFDDVALEEMLTLPVSTIDSTKLFKLNDLFCYLFALRYEYNGIADDIVDTTSKALAIKGFNFRADFAALAQYISDNGFTTADLGISDFQIPTTPVLTFASLLNIFTKNKAVRKHVMEQMINADNKRIYTIYKTIYDALMVEDLNFTFFKKQDGTTATSFTDFIQGRDSTLYFSLMNVKAITDAALRQSTIISILTDVVYEIGLYINTDTYPYIFSNIPGVSGDCVIQYIVKMINFFKSYNVQLLGSSTLYTFNDPLQNTIRPIDELLQTSVFNKDEVAYVLEDKTSLISTTLVDTYKQLERIEIQYVYDNGVL